MISTEQGTPVSRISANHSIPDHISGRAMFRPGWKKPNLFFYWPKPDPSSGPKNPNPSPPDVWPHSPWAVSLSPTQTSTPYFIEKSAQNSIDILKITNEESEMDITVYSS